MEIEKLNELFRGEEIEEVLSKISKQNDFRMCLNKNVVSEFKVFFGKIITLSFVIDILPDELEEIYEDAERYLSKKLSVKLNLENIYKQKDKVEEYFNKTLGGRQFLFHGTNSSMEKMFAENVNTNYLNIDPCRTIDEIYHKHNIYKVFESGIQDFNAKNFWVTTFPDSACFYALQSPEYFARFASRSDYYKQDIFKYDRLAYYRKDFDACKKNLKLEMREFGFDQNEKKIVLENFEKLWENIVTKDFKSVIFFKEVEADNIHHFDETDKIYDMLLKYFTKVHFVYDINNFKENLKEIVLPDIKSHMRRQRPILNRKFVVKNDKKYIPDFYFVSRYSTKKYFTFDINKSQIFDFVDKNLEKNDRFKLIELVNEAVPNTYLAKKFLKQKSLPAVSEVIAFYKKKFEESVEKLESTTNMSEKTSIIKEICENVGLKYVVSLKYNKYFKDVSLHSVYQYRKYLGVKLLEHYDGLTTITAEKVEKLVELYKKLLNDKDFVLNTDVPLQVLNGEIDLVR